MPEPVSPADTIRRALEALNGVEHMSFTQRQSLLRYDYVGEALAALAEWVAVGERDKAEIERLESLIVDAETEAAMCEACYGLLAGASSERGVASEAAPAGSGLQIPARPATGESVLVEPCALPGANAHEGAARRYTDGTCHGTHEDYRAALADLDALEAQRERDRRQIATPQFLDDVRAVVRDHWSGLPENRPDESVWARLDAVLYDDDGNPREHPDYAADPLNAVPAGESPGERDRRKIAQLTEALGHAKAEIDSILDTEDVPAPIALMNLQDFLADAVLAGEEDAG